MILTQIADAITSKIQTTVNTAVAGDSTIRTATCKRVWDVLFQTPEDCLAIQDRRVYVLPIDKNYLEAADRTENRNVFRFGIIVADRIPGDLIAADKEDQLTAWIDEAVNWVNTNVLSPVASVNFSPIQDAYLESFDWREVIKRGVVRTYGIYWSEIDIEFFIEEPN